MLANTKLTIKKGQYQRQYYCPGSKLITFGPFLTNSWRIWHFCRDRREQRGKLYSFFFLLLPPSSSPAATQISHGSLKPESVGVILECAVYELEEKRRGGGGGGRGGWRFNSTSDPPTVHLFDPSVSLSLFPLGKRIPFSFSSFFLFSLFTHFLSTRGWARAAPKTEDSFSLFVCVCMGQLVSGVNQLY